MADSGDLEPADVSFAQPELTYWRIDGGDRQGTLSEAAGYYRSLDRGRLVVLGEPGAGKTILAIQLALDLAEAVMAVADNVSPLLARVPVRLSLSAFDPGDDVDAAAKVVSVRLDGWLTRHLVTTFGLPTQTAAALVAGGRILPVLDGLDEMDPDDAAPRRAASVIRAVNHSSAGNVRPVVITCRTHRYQQLSGHVEPAGKVLPAEPETTSSVGRREVVQDATVVGVEPLIAQSVVDYLTKRFPDPADRLRIESRWRPIVERLTGSTSGGDPLVAALCSPLRLFLTVAAYRHHNSTPDELTRLTTTAQLDEHLFARLVPAVLEQHPPAGRQYEALEVTRWLTTLAHYLARQGECGRSSSDLRLDQLWPAAGLRASRYAATAVTTTAAGALLAFGVLARWPPDVLPVLGLGTLIVVVAWIAWRPAVDLRRLDLSGLRTSVGRHQIGRLLAIGLLFVANSPWPRYLFAATFLARRGDLPRRPAVFLDWAYQAGLMRLSGVAVQFRHREFQTWLANRDQPGDGPRPRWSTT